MGKLQEILDSHQPPFGFVKGSTSPTRQELVKWKQDAEFIERHKATKKPCLTKTGDFESMGVVPFSALVKHRQRRPDNMGGWQANKDYVAYERKRGNPNVTMNPAIGSN